MSLDQVQPEISVIVVSFNTKDFTLKAIETFLRETRVSHELIVVDNDSKDGSAEAIEENFPGIKLIKSGENLGFAAANNKAAEVATGKKILLLNPDTEVLDGAVDRLYRFSLEKPLCGIWGGKTLYADMSLNPSNCWMKQTWWSLVCEVTGLSSLFHNTTLFNPEGIGGWDRDGERAVDIVSGCFLLTDADLWRKLGGFGKKYFMYGEEADYCLRARKLGARPRISSKPVIIHHGGVSETVPSDKIVRLLKAKNMLIHDHFIILSGLGSFLLMLWPFTRAAAHRLLFFFGVRSSSDKMNIWTEVWKRRMEWHGEQG